MRDCSGVYVVLFSANEDRQYIHDVVCKVQVEKFEPKSGVCMRACVSGVLVMYGVPYRC